MARKKSEELWLFDYNQGIYYEAFSQCEDYEQEITKFLEDRYDFSDKTILEIGAGSGKFTRFLSSACSKLYVVEKSESLMRINRMKNQGFSNIEFILSNVTDLKLPSSSIDVVFAGWSMTSMREHFDVIFDMFKSVLRDGGYILLVENAGDDEFCKVMDIENFTNDMESMYEDMGFLPLSILDTVIKLSHEEVFYDAFPNKMNVKLDSLELQHKVLLLEMQASTLKEEI